MDRRFAALVGVGVVGLGAYCWPYYQAYEKRPDLWSQAVAAGVDINNAVLQSPEQVDYQNGFSPVERQLAVESELLGVDVQHIQDVVDHIAREATWTVLIAAGESDIREAEKRLWEMGRQAVIIEEIARQLRLAHVIYGVEETFFRGFDPDANAGNFVHLDCDLISHVFMHVAREMDLDVREHNAPLHVYLSYGPPKGSLGERLYIEPTEFRSTLKLDGVVDKRGQELGLGFWVHEDYHRTSRHTVHAARSVIESAGYYEFSTDRDMEDTITDSVALASERLSVLLDRPDWSNVARPAREARLEGSRDPNLVTNLWLGIYETAYDNAHIDPEVALVAADELAELELSHGDLLLYRGPFSATLRMRAHRHLGNDAEALSLAEEIHEHLYNGRVAWSYGGRTARDEHQAEALYTIALLRPRGTLDHHNEVLLPVLNYDRGAGEERNDIRLADMYRRSAWILTGYGMKETARDYRERADAADPR